MPSAIVKPRQPVLILRHDCLVGPLKDVSTLPTLFVNNMDLTPLPCCRRSPVLSWWARVARACSVWKGPRVWPAKSMPTRCCVVRACVVRALAFWSFRHTQARMNIRSMRGVGFSGGVDGRRTQGGSGSRHWARRHGGCLAAVLLFMGWLSCPAMAALDLHVATNGNDAWSGELTIPNDEETDGPFATLTRARDRVRRLKAAAGLPQGGVLVTVHGGVYPLVGLLELSAQDSGAADAPVVYRAAAGEEVRLMGGMRVSDFKPVTDPGVRERLAEPARDPSAPGRFAFAGSDRLRHGKRGRPRVVLPGQAHAPGALAQRRLCEGHGGLGHDACGRARDQRLRRRSLRGATATVRRRWTGEKDVWLHGYWFWDWSDQRQRVKGIDIEKQTIELEASVSQLRLPQGPMVLRVQSPVRDRSAGRMVFGSSTRASSTSGRPNPSDRGRRWSRSCPR